MMFVEMRDKRLLNNKKIIKQAELFAILADPTRLRLLNVLCLQNPPGCHCVNNLSQLLGITQPAVSQHLRVLKSAGLVIGEKRGFRMHYFINAKGLKRFREILSTGLIFSESYEEVSCEQDCHPSKTTA
jgi:ArsR family transcriptional regulator